MREIHFDNPHRQKHFDFFNDMNHPHWTAATLSNATRRVTLLKAAVVQ